MMISEESKIFLRSMSPFILVLVVLPLMSFLTWISWTSKELNVVVIDKTVPNDLYREHRSIFWALQHLKFRKEGNESYDVATDYYGFFPDQSPQYGTKKDFSKQDSIAMATMVSKLDVIYFADTYGVFENDFKAEVSTELSKKIYGGLNRGDINLLREAKAQQKTVIAEFNSMASPTPKGIRTEFENLMGIKWTGWIARYFDNMDTTANEAIPDWLISQYLEQHEGKWGLLGPGIFFIHESGEVEAFVNELDYNGELPYIHTLPTLNQGFKLPEMVPYPEWFDVILVEREYQVISYYDIKPTEIGKTKLREMGLPRFFPAAMVKDIGEGQLYYFSGDFADLPVKAGSVKFFGLPALWRGLHVISDYADRESFYWNYYYPLLSQVLERSYTRKSSDK